VGQSVRIFPVAVKLSNVYLTNHNQIHFVVSQRLKASNVYCFRQNLRYPAISYLSQQDNLLTQVLFSLFFGGYRLGGNDNRY